MTSEYYLLSHPNSNCPDRGDGRYWGYAVMQGQPFLISVHTTESFADQLGEDTGAEAVAAYFTRTAEPASYHTIVDSDSTVRCLPAGLDGTTATRRSIAGTATPPTSGSRSLCGPPNGRPSTRHGPPRR